jgi:hypothetical protein
MSGRGCSFARQATASHVPPVEEGCSVPILARTAGLPPKLAEEQENPIGFQLAKAAEDSVTD